MIQAVQPNQLKNQNQTEDIVSRVPGFATPVNNLSNTGSNGNNGSNGSNSNSPTPNQQVNEEKLTPEWVKFIYKWWHKIALILLIGHGLLGLWESIYFIVVEYSELSHLLELHQVDVQEVNQLLSRFIITITTTFVNVLFAIRLSKVKETTAHNIDLIVATFLIVTTKLIQNFLVQLDLVNYVLELFAK